MRTVLIITLLFMMLALPRARAEVTLTAGTSRLVFPSQANGRFGISLSSGTDANFEQSAPASAVVRRADKEETIAEGYTTVTEDHGGVIATAEVRTPAGSRLRFVDRWSADRDQSFRLEREVTVLAADPRDLGFDSILSLSPARKSALSNVDIFAPGVWYRQNEHVVPKAIGANLSGAVYLIKETRLALPLVMLRDKAGGPSLTMLHLDAKPSTKLDDNSFQSQTDASIQYGSLGPCVDAAGVSLKFCFPGSEGERSYGAPGWRRRWHPMTAGFSQGYLLVIRDRPAETNFSKAISDAWRFGYHAYSPAVKPAASTEIYREGLAIFDRYYRDDFRSGGRGLPFMIFLGLHPPKANDRRVAPPGVRGPSDYHLQSGFVGQQIAAAYLKLRQALISHDQDGQTRWSSVVDFWVKGSLSKAGVPRTDYFCERAAWGRGPSFLRTISDGSEAVLDAYRCSQANGRPRKDWLAYTRCVGDWLQNLQADDGTWARSYAVDGSVDRPAKYNTTNPIRFLVKLSAVTGESKYLESAKRAGEWCLVNVDATSAYVGGTPDNDNTLDKEAGVLAFYGFQSLYDATGDKRWLAAASRAADFAETWTFAWSYSVAPTGGEIAPTRSPWPACGLIGQSLVATGHSYVDMFMAGCSTAYYRLAIQTGDDHYRQFARLLADGANRPADLTGALHYPAVGLIDEGIQPTEFVARGPGNCLTWCTVAQVRPVADLQDLFGCDRIDDVDAKFNPRQRAERNLKWLAQDIR